MVILKCDLFVVKYFFKNKYNISMSSKFNIQYNGLIKIRGHSDIFFRKYDKIETPSKAQRTKFCGIRKAFSKNILNRKLFF